MSFSKRPTPRRRTGRPFLLTTSLTLFFALTACVAHTSTSRGDKNASPVSTQTQPAAKATISSAPLSEAKQCNSGLWLQVLGSGGPELTPDRASASYLVWDHGQAVFMLDSGGGSFLRFAQAKAQWRDLKALLFSHFHADHSVDLTAFIKASWFGQRRQDLPLLGPWGNRLMPDANEFVARNIGKNSGAWAYLSDFYDDKPGASYRIKPQTLPASQNADSPVYQGDGWRVYAHRVTHGPLPALAWRLEKNGHVLIYSGDTTGEGLAPLLRKPVHLFLAHNAIPQGAGATARSLHMTPQQIGQLAAIAQPQLLVLSHRMHRSLGQEDQTARLIAQYWSGTLRFANDLDRFCIP